MRWFVGSVSVLVVLGCGGQSPIGSMDQAAVVPVPPSEASEPPEAEASWVDVAVQEALEWEVMPGTTAEEDDGTRAAALRTFFLAHPEYEDPARRAPLAESACGLDGTEAAHEYLVNPPPKVPVVVDVSVEDWKVFATHADRHCTSDDWGWYASESNMAAADRGVTTAHGGPDNDVLIVRRDGVEVARVPLAGQGFLVVRAGAKEQELGYAPTPEILPEMEAYFADAP